MKNLEKFVETFRAIVPRVDEWEMRTFHATFAVYKGKTLAIGINRRKTHPANLVNKKYNRNGVDFSQNGATCSELACLTKVRNMTDIPLSKMVLVNFRVDRKGEIGFSAPCHACQNLCKYLGVKTLFYTDSNGNFIKYLH